VAGLLADEIAQETKRSIPIGEVLGWNAATTVDEDGVGLDSLMRLSAARRVADYFGLRDVGYEDYLLMRRTLGEWAEIVELSWNVQHEAVTFRTSGSTGPAKNCEHPFTQLEDEAKQFSRLVGPIDRVVSFVAPHHIHGFLHTILLPRFSGAPSVDFRGVAPGSRCKRLAEGDLIVATPFVWGMLADEGVPIPDRTVGITSTAPMSRELSERLAGRGLSRLIEIYGSSETGGIGWRSDFDAPYTLLPCWRRRGAGIARADGVERALPDVVEWAGERALKPIRRGDDAVQIAGVNVYPTRVAETIRRLPIVTDCVVRRGGRADNARLEAFIVCSEPMFDREAAAREVAAFCVKELSAPERPVRIEVGTSLPLDAMGKPTAW
jgi:4-coumarate--CoA ligase (photoactive yellow protein activation family)